MYRSFGQIMKLALVLLAATFLFACDGSKGKAGATGAQGPQGTQGDQGDQGPPGPVPDDVAAAIAEASVESCATCHSGVGTEKHQAVYDKYVDASTLAMTFTSLASVPSATAGKYDVTLMLSITKNGLPFVDAANLPSMDQKAFYAVQYDSLASPPQYLNSQSLFQRSSRGNFGDIASNGDGTYTLTVTGQFDYAPEAPAAPFDGTHVYGYLAQGALLEHAGDTGSELPGGTHVHLYDDVASAALAYGTAAVTDANPYVSAANVAGCEKCHGTPYLKHGYRDPIVAGLPDFASCKSCHYDDRNGGHRDWQYMVDQPVKWANGDVLAPGKYDYKAKLMNDVHMAHAMEFPYPQSMSNCSTCHEGKLDQILDNENFTAETCKSCHPIQGTDAWPEEAYAQGHRAPAFEYLWQRDPLNNTAFHTAFIDDPLTDCTECHGNVISRPFNEYHTGYDASIYDVSGTKYAELYTVAIDSISWVDIEKTLLKIDFSTNNPTIGVVPEVLVSFYGWDSKNFIVPSHARDANPACVSRGTPGCRFEFEPGDVNPLFEGFAETAPGVWTVTANLAAFQAVETDDILTLIANEDVNKAEITITPTLELGGIDVVLKAVGETFDLSAGVTVADYFKGANSTVEINKCNVCHDSLASSFHDGSGRGGDGVEVCKNCHNPTFAGSHLEMASRSIDSYVHAIHSFQDFDVGDTFETFDAVLAKRYDQHISHVFPNFTIRNCEACHRAGKYNVPDQSQSMPGLLAASDAVATWYMLDGDDLAVEDASGRNIGALPEYVTGPASRACGGCHRARNINDDLAGDLASFNAHTAAGGTLVENDSANTAEDPADEVLFGIIDKIMSMFK